MDITPLNISLVRQQPGSDDCLRACTLMLFRFNNEKITKKEIWKKLHVYKKHSGLSGIYLTDVGRLVLQKGHKVTIHHNDWQCWDEATMNESKKRSSSFINALKSLKKAKKKWADKKIIDKEIAFVRAGGKFKIQLPKLENIDFHLYRKTPVLLLVRGQHLYHSPKQDYNQGILVIGKKLNKYLIRDPFLAIKELEQDELYLAWARTGGWMLTVIPKEEKSKISQAKLSF